MIGDQLGQKLPPEGAAIMAEEFAADGVVYDRDGLKIIAFEVDHGDVIKPPMATGSSMGVASRSSPAILASTKTS
jgi:hypothetical protein